MLPAFIILTIAMGMTISCTVSKVTATTVVKITEQPQPTRTQPPPTITPLSPTATTLPTPTASFDLIFAELFPLEIGVTRVYSVTTSDLDPAQVEQMQLTGIVTETIVSQSQNGDEWHFGTSITGFDAGTSWGGYTVTNSELTGGMVLGIRIPWPIEAGTKWIEHGIINETLWYIHEQSDLATLAGTFRDCYYFETRKASSDFEYWFCPGVGIAKAGYYHFGQGFTQIWELISIAE